MLIQTSKLFETTISDLNNFNTINTFLNNKKYLGELWLFLWYLTELIKVKLAFGSSHWLLISCARYLMMTNVSWNLVNDNPPVFDRPTYETQITEEDDRNLPKRVLQVNQWIDGFDSFLFLTKITQFYFRSFDLPFFFTLCFRCRKLPGINGDDLHFLTFLSSDFVLPSCF